jgi:hypothetical protein
MTISRGQLDGYITRFREEMETGTSNVRGTDSHGTGCIYLGAS